MISNISLDIAKHVCKRILNNSKCMKLSMKINHYGMVNSYATSNLKIEPNDDIIKNNADISSKSSTVDSSEVELHTGLKQQWWDKDGTMKALHTLNNLRVPFIRDGILETYSELKDKINTPCPLRGIKILEVGCGGGILSEPLAKLGANVTGLDASEQLISLAKERASSYPENNLNYIYGTIEEFSESHNEEFDAVIASEVVEHISNKELFLESCLKVLHPNGSLFITTINKTTAAWFGGIIIAENILSLVPKGTHNWEKFISPDELIRLLEKYNCKMRLIHGMTYCLPQNKWHWTSNTSINYAIQVIKRQKNTDESK